MKTVFVFLALTAVAFSQSDRARLTGRVVDPTGASVPNASIVVTNLTTEAKRQIESGPDGSYRVDGLLSAPYKITATAPGFADVVVPELVLSVGQERTIDLHLQPASVRETVTVTAEGTSADLFGASAEHLRSFAYIPLRASQTVTLVVRAMAQNAGRVVSLTTATKLGTAGPYVVADLDRIDTLVSDAPAEDLEVYGDLGIEVIQA